jgi:hypothetical protein
VLPFRSQPSASLPAIDITIDQDLDAATSTGMLAVIRTERRIEELDAAIQDAAFLRVPKRTRDRLVHAYEHALQTRERAYGIVTRWETTEK